MQGVQRSNSRQGPVTEASAPETSPFHLQHAIRALGTAAFDNALFGFVQRTIPIDYLTVFVHRDGERAPTVAMSASSGGPGWDRRLSSSYLGRYWRVDPATKPLIEDCSNGRVGTVRTRPLDIDNPQYRQECYADLRVRERLALSSELGPECVRLNVFRGMGHYFFSDAEIEWLRSQAVLLGALAWRHQQIDQIRCPRARWEPPELERRLTSVAGGLSNRERQVGARIAAGWTSDAIAADLGLSKNSILTFRRRLYAKLRVNSVARLYRLIEGA